MMAKMRAELSPGGFFKSHFLAPALTAKFCTSVCLSVSQQEGKQLEISYEAPVIELFHFL